ncbi:MAG: hypothetical protein E7158_02085 [Firmicutes bacterium]|nr:hypothetical protein [Bacillota bacterium]
MNKIIEKSQSESSNYANVDYSFRSPKSDISIPLLYGDSLLLYILKENILILDSFKYNLIKYSGLFEYSYKLDKPFTITLGLKKEYDCYIDFSLAEIALNNMKKIKEKDIKLLDVYDKESSILEKLKNMEEIKKALLNIFRMKRIEFSLNDIYYYKDFNDFSNAYLYCTHKYMKFNDLQLIERYYSFLSFIDRNKNIFIKFADKSYVKIEDFIELKNSIEKELINRLGKTKFDIIIDSLNNIKEDETYNDIISECLVVKKNIDEEIKDVEIIREKTSKSDPVYNQLTQRLNKLLLYKKHFDTEQVINGESVFKNYYGFEFDGVYVFDYFIDSDSSKDIYKKAKRESGNGIYILTYEDYIKVKEMKNKTEVRNYIRKYLYPCADYMNHNENIETKLLERVTKIKMNIAKKKYLLKLVSSPVTTEEIELTQEEIDCYVSKFFNYDFEKLSEIKDHVKNKKLKEAIGKKISVELVDKEKKGQLTKEKLTDDDRDKINNEIEEMLKNLEEANIERKKEGLEEVTFEKDNYFNVYRVLIDYKNKCNIFKKSIRDVQVAYKTKIRTFHDNEYHCELCGSANYDPLYFESHHFIPISQCGPDDIYNTVCLCLNCHKAIHGGRVTDMQNYMLIETIKEHIKKENPELLNKFEMTLGFKENSYLEQIENIEKEIIKIEQSMDKCLDKETSDDEILKEIDKLQNECDTLEEKRAMLISLANRFQDYYRYSGGYSLVRRK